MGGYTDAPYKYDLEKLAQLAGEGLNEYQIADYLGIHSVTFARHKKLNPDIARAIKAGKARANQMVSNVLFNKAVQGDVSAIIWYEKTRTGRSDKLEVITNVKRELAQVLDILEAKLTPDEYYKVLTVLAENELLETELENIVDVTPTNSSTAIEVYKGS